jgi:copper homeostasis protein (lipoprotein)
MRIIKPILASFIIFFVFPFFSSAIAQSEAQKGADAHHAEHKMEWPGVYNGLIPCADCVGIKTSLALNKNNTYFLMTQNLGKSLREFTEKGKFTWSEDGATIILTSRDGSTTRQYFVGENMLTQLDSAGNRHTGKDADKYTLHRNDLTAKEPKHLH